MKKPNRKRRPRRIDEPPRLRFRQVKGKIVEFIEMSANVEYPVIDIGFEDQTGLRFVMGSTLTMEPTYSDWKSGNERVLRSWKPIECL